MVCKGLAALSMVMVAAGSPVGAQAVPAEAAAAKRVLPDAQAGAFAQVFAQGTEVLVRVPADARGKATRWAAVDEQGRALLAGDVAAGADSVSLGPADIGWYRVGFLDATGAEAGWTTAAVLARCPRPPRTDSPVCTDTANAWFARQDPVRQERFAVLAALARVNWARDRMTWGEAEPKPGTLADGTSYDSSADLLSRHGLAVLQVFHGTPGWAADKALDGDHPGKRFPRDLRQLYSYCRAMAQRYHGRVLAWEPWNEANIDGFGGHTTDEMCTLQKAAFLGFKAGDPELPVCWNVYAGSPSATGRDLIVGNEAYAYMDTFNIHTYSPVESYVGEFAPARDAASGRPIWLSECGIHVHSRQPRPWGDLSPEESWRQARFIPASFATSLFAGVDRHFFFILGNYMEGDVQFGLLRQDMTPRPGYCALAAVGRFLDGATCLGRLPVSAGNPQRVVAFRAFPDGVERDVLVAWSATGAEVPGPALPDGAAVHDTLGRPVPAARFATLSAGPLFALLPPGGAAGLALEKPPRPAAARPGQPHPVVLQADFAMASRDLHAQAHRFAAGATVEIPVHAYNFSNQAVQGTIAVTGLPVDWRAEPASWTTAVGPLDRADAVVRIRLPTAGAGLLQGSTVTLRGDFGQDLRPVLQFRLIGDLATVQPVAQWPIASALRTEAWEDNIVGGSALSHTPEAGGMRFSMRFGEADPWSYPRLTLDPTDRPDGRVQALRFKLQVHEGKGAIRVQFIKENGSCYIADTGADAGVRTPQTVTVVVASASWGAWSAPDPDGKLQVEAIRRLMIGINSERKSSVAFSVTDLQWVRFEP